MREIRDSKIIAIELTNACILSCAYCTRHVRHIRSPFFISEDHFTKALNSLKNWKGIITLIGGEPTIHPEFESFCDIFKKKFPFRQRGLHTAGGKKYDEYENQGLIDETFGWLNYNNHKNECYHQPPLIALDEVISNPELSKQYIENCWVQNKWSASIGPNGVFFCEMAQSYDILFKTGKGYPIEVDWWKKDLTEFADQREFFCKKCSMCLPFKGESDTTKTEKLSQSHLNRLKELRSPYLKKNDRFQIVNEKLSEDDLNKLEPQSTKNIYTEPKANENYYYREYLGKDNRLSKKENLQKQKEEKLKELKRILTGKLSEFESYKAKKKL